MSTVPAVDTTATDLSAPRGSEAREVAKDAALLREVPRPRRTGWWGMVLFLATDSSLFASLFGTYYYLEFVTSWHSSWPPSGDPLPKLVKASILTGLMLFSVLPMLVADLGLRAGSRVRTLIGMLFVGLVGIAFSIIEVWEFSDELTTSWPSKDAYSSIFYTLLGFHLAHVMLLALYALLLVAATLAGRVTRSHHIMVRTYALFWYASVVLWSLIYLILYWSVRL